MTIKKPKPEMMWFIAGRHGLYYGGHGTRREAIEDHCRAIGHDWPVLRSHGDHAVKCVVTPTTRGPSDE